MYTGGLTNGVLAFRLGLAKVWSCVTANTPSSARLRSGRTMLATTSLVPESGPTNSSRANSLEPFLAPLLGVRVVGRVVEFPACSCAPVAHGAKVRVAGGEDDFREVAPFRLVRHVDDG